MIKQIIEKYTPYLILIVTLSSISQWSRLPIDITAIWWTVYAFIVLIFIKAKSTHYDRANDKEIIFIKWYLLWNAICIVRGLFIAENYWEWKNLVGTGFVFLLPLSIYITTNSKIVLQLISTWIKYALPAFFIISLTFINPNAVGRYLMPVSFLLIFFPILNGKLKGIVLFFSLVVILWDLNARSNVIKFIVPFIFGLAYYFQGLLSINFLRVSRLVLLITPIIFFILGVTGKFNIFKMDEYISGDYKATSVVEGEIKEGSLTVDTRTFLYEEVIFSAIKYDYVFLGRTPARGNESPTFGMHTLKELGTGKMERFANEVSILNVFTWTGILGVVLYFLVFLRATYLAVNKSNSYFMRLIGLNVAFRWAYGWIEDFSRFDLSYLFLWIMIGMCYSKSFRMMNDLQIRYWVNGLIEEKYIRRLRAYTQYLQQKKKAKYKKREMA